MLSVSKNIQCVAHVLLLFVVIVTLFIRGVDDRTVVEGRVQDAAKQFFALKLHAIAWKAKKYLRDALFGGGILLPHPVHRIVFCGRQWRKRNVFDKPWMMMTYIVAAVYRVVQKVSHYQELSLNRIKTRQCSYISHRFW